MDFTPPGWSPAGQTNQQREVDISRVGGWLGCVGRAKQSGMSPPENTVSGVSLPALWCPPSRTDTIWPAGMLLSSGGGGVNAASYAEGWGGGGDGLGLSINSASRNH